jgi:hypothetical protein
MITRERINGETEAMVQDLLGVLASFKVHDEESHTSSMSSISSRPSSPCLPCLSPAKPNLFQRGAFGTHVDAACREASRLARLASDATAAAVESTQHAKLLIHDAQAADDQHRALALQEERSRQAHWMRTFRNEPLLIPSSPTPGRSLPSSPPHLPAVWLPMALTCRICHDAQYRDA